jgi:hypothetical protein
MWRLPRYDASGVGTRDCVTPCSRLYNFESHRAAAERAGGERPMGRRDRSPRRCGRRDDCRGQQPSRMKAGSVAEPGRDGAAELEERLHHSTWHASVLQLTYDSWPSVGYAGVAPVEASP